MACSGVKVSSGVDLVNVGMTSDMTARDEMTARNTIAPSQIVLLLDMARRADQDR